MTALLSGPEFWVTWGSGLATGALTVLVWAGLALRATRGVTLRRLFRDWAQTGRRQ